MRFRAFTCVFAFLLFPLEVRAQDTRTVVEPKFPAACITLAAGLTIVADTTVAAADESKLDTKRIQQAIDDCSAGHAVVLKAIGVRRAFLSGPLTLKAGVTLIVDTNTTLFASRNPRDYDADEPGRCGTVDARGRGCKALITTERATSAAVMGPGTIDGRGWAKLIGRDSSWWDLAQAARAGGSQNCPRLLQINRSDDFTLYKITLKNSPNFHVVYDRGNGFTAWGVVIDTRDKWARNTDGIDPSSATNVTITRSYINTGDDNIAIKAGGNGPSSNITISHNHFYRGHGVSIGSETNGGAHAIRVFDLSIEGADNGLRIKSNASRGGLVHDVEYKDVCIKNTKNVIEMDAFYTASPETTGNLYPEFRNIRLKGVRVVDAGNVILQGYDAERMLRMSWDDVYFDRPASIKVMTKNASIAKGPGPMNLVIAGDNVQVTGTSSDAPRLDCERKFVPFPGTALALPPGDGAYSAIVDALAAKPDSDRTKFRNPQAVALMTDLGSDRATFINVKVAGYQDTLFPNSGRAYFKNCEIWGHVDFIFGAGQAVFDDCRIVSRDRGSASNNGYIAAPSTNGERPFGFLFLRSRLEKERPQMAAASVTLGRPWHPFADATVNSAAAYIDCWMDDHIGAKGWDRMSSVDSTGTRTWYEPADARFAEFGTTGPGAVKSPSRRVLTAAEAKRYTVATVLDGWTPR